MKKKNVDRPAETPTPAEAPERAEVLRRVSVLISEADHSDMQRHFTEDKPGHPLVSVWPPRAKHELTDTQRAKRKAYRQRPDVREKQRAYRALRAKRIREAKAAKRAAEQGAAE